MTNTQLEHSHHDRAAKHNSCHLSLLLNDIELASNIGSLFRISDALGINHIYLCGSTSTPPNRKITKSSRSTEKYVPYSCENDAVALLTSLKQQGHLVVSLEISSHSIPLTQFIAPKDKAICLVIGSENEGVNQTLLNLSDQTVHIPMKGHNSSMNVANACAIAAYDILNQISE
ncbi:MAG: hypothetical protein K6L81_16460 [Agarilytica sp.]